MTLSFFPFPAPILFEVSGKDAERYLQARLTNNIKTLSTNNHLQAAALTPQGRTEGFFTVIKKSDQSFILTSPSGNYETLVNSFKRYKVADRFEIIDLRNEKQLIHISSDSRSALIELLKNAGFTAQNEFLLSTEDNYAYQISRISTDGFDILVSNNLTTQLLTKLKQENFSEIPETHFNYLRIKNNTPSFPQELNDSAVFLEADLENAVSFKKGCYVGQEVIEKVDSHGRLGKKLSRIKFPGVIEFERLTKVKLAEDPDEIVGKIYSFASAPDNSETLAYASLAEELTAGIKVVCNKAVGEII